MTLNNYAEEVREFLSKMNSDNENNKQKIEGLSEEFTLQSAIIESDMPSGFY